MPIDPVALARALVLALFPALAEGIRLGITPRAAFDRVWTEQGAMIRFIYGPDVAREVIAELDALMAWHVLTPVGRAAWFGLRPVADLTPPGEAIATPAGAIGPLRRAWRQLWGETG